MVSTGITASLGSLAAGLDPGIPAMAGIISQLRASVGRDEADLAAAGLRRVTGRLAEAPVRVTFGGHFSSGKSSLINMLIGTELLPVSDFRETGVPCLLQSGDANQVLVQTRRRAKKIAFTAEAIAQYVSLTGADGRSRNAELDAGELRITLASRPIPAGATWVDSPGINDARMKEIATGLARQGDVLVWVINSRQPLGLTEQEFLAERIAEGGPASVVFVLNAFLNSATTQAWQAFTAKQHPYVSQLIAKNIDTGTVPAPLVAVSAQAAVTTPAAFGGPEARALLASVSDPAAPQVAVTRVFRAIAEFRDLVTQLNARVAAEEQRLAPEYAKIAAIEKERAQQQDDFEQAVRREVTALLRGYTRTAERPAAEVIEDLMSKFAPKEPSYYAAQYNDKLRAAMNTVARDVVKKVNKSVRAHRRRKLDDAGEKAIATALRPRSLYISGYTKPSVEGIRKKLGVWWNLETNQKNEIERELNYAAADASTRMLDAVGRIAEQASRHCAPRERPVSQVDERRLNAIRDAIRTLEKNVGDPLQRALSAAQTQAGG